MSLVDSASPDVGRAGLVLVPVGSTEQHGPHLPLDTDTVIAAAVAEDLSSRVGGVVAPALTYGASGEHQSFAGTISIGTETLTAVLIEVARSLTCWAERVIFVNGHGGNVFALRAAVSRLQQEGRDVQWVPCAVAAADAHAGRTETSLMLHLDPARVRLHKARTGNATPVESLLPAIVAGGVAAVSPNGVLGDPAGASQSEGEALLREMVANAHGRVVEEARR